MCGRYQRRATREEIIRKFEITDGLEYFDKYQPSDEVFPGTNITAVNNQRLAQDIWWTIYDKSYDGKPVAPINAKAENVLRAQMFKDAFLKDRILIPATAIYEWQVQPDKSKKKFEIWFDEPLFAMAGIARNSIHKGEEKRCGVILTTTPNEIFAEIHNAKQRQAVVIREADYVEWLDPKTTVDRLKALMQPLPSSDTKFAEAS